MLVIGITRFLVMEWVLRLKMQSEGRLVYQPLVSQERDTGLDTGRKSSLVIMQSVFVILIGPH